MIGGISIEYRPTPRALPTLLAMIDDEGYTLRSIKAAPEAQGWAMLSLDLDGYSSRTELAALGERMCATGFALRVTHLSERTIARKAP